ncbi:hypothetical protein HPB49_026307 [Dermacentor silvarum]|nr:hypothetical protein HPB49_026307 [Dermacentor silvarum]
MDVCPQPDTKVCPICGVREPEDRHDCSPRCAVCGEQHLTGDRSCQKRLKRTRRKGRLTNGKHGSAQQHSSRWFVNEDEELELSEFPELRHLPAPWSALSPRSVHITQRSSDNLTVRHGRSGNS